LKKLEKAKEKERKKKEKEEKKDKSKKTDKDKPGPSSAAAPTAGFSGRVKDFDDDDELEQSTSSTESISTDQADQDANAALKELYKAIDYDDNTEQEKAKKVYPPEVWIIAWSPVREETKLCPYSMSKFKSTFEWRKAPSSFWTPWPKSPS